MSYNCKILDYGKTKQTRLYSNIIECGTPLLSARKSTKSKSSSSSNEKANKTRSENRSKNTIFDIARANEWEWFVTLTFDPSKVEDRTDYDALIKKVGNWLNHLKRKSPNIKYLMVAELHKDGKSYHFHGLLADCDGLSFVDSGVVKSGKKIYNLDNFKFGFSTATRVTSSQRVAAYITKYFTKELETKIKGKQRFIASQNVKRPQVTKCILPTDEWTQYLCGLKIQFCKSIDSHGMKVNYVESI